MVTIAARYKFKRGNVFVYKQTNPHFTQRGGGGGCNTELLIAYAVIGLYV